MYNHKTKIPFIFEQSVYLVSMRYHVTELDYFCDVNDITDQNISLKRSFSSKNWKRNKDHKTCLIQSIEFGFSKEIESFIFAIFLVAMILATWTLWKHCFLT